MIQSRAQFGVLGGALPLFAVVITYILYTAADGLLVEGSIAALLKVNNAVSLALFALLTLIIAYVVYELIHRMAAVLAVTSALLFAVTAYLCPMPMEVVLAPRSSRCISVLQGNVMNLYSAYMSSVTIYSGVRSMRRVSHLSKIALMTVLIAVATGISIGAQDDFQTYFSDILSVMIYLLVPWSAINLADYYLVRHGHYVIEDMYRLDRIYRAVRWDTILIYLLGIACQVPLMKMSFYTGAIAKLLDADFAWVPGLLIPATLYVARERRHQNSISAFTIRHASQDFAPGGHDSRPGPTKGR